MNWVKYTACFISIFLGCFAVSCNVKNQKDGQIEMWQLKMDALSNTQLDSIYKMQSLECDSLQKIMIPKIVDSLMKDSGYLKVRKR